MSSSDLPPQWLPPALPQEPPSAPAPMPDPTPTAWQGPQQLSQPPWHPPMALGAPLDSTPVVPRRRRRRLLVAVAAVAVLVIGAGLTGGWLLLHCDGTRYNYQGKPVSHPAQVLATGEARVAALVAHQPVARGRDDHCYFALPSSGPAATRRTVSSGIYCGPMKLVNSENDDQFLHYYLSPKPAGKNVEFTVSDNPVSSDTETLPDGIVLQRPGGAKHTAASFGMISAPIAPPADQNAFVSVDRVGTQTSLKPPAAPQMAGYDGGVILETAASVGYYGHAGDARSAPAGQRLIAFTLKYHGPNGGKLTDLDLGVSVNGAPLQPIPDLSDSYAEKVIAVPPAASSVNLVLRSKATTQEISLLTGKPAANNIVVLARQNQRDTLTIAKDLPITFTVNGNSATTTMHVKITEADLEYYEGDDGEKVPASSAKAYLHIRMRMTFDNVPAADGATELPAGLLSFKSRDGITMPARDVGTDEYNYVVIEVPGLTEAGTLTIGGSALAPSGQVRLTLPQPFSFPIEFAPG